jgi:hypothetical protein
MSTVHRPGSWVYVRSEDDLYTVGFYAPSGRWHTDSDHTNREDAAKRAAWLNGSDVEIKSKTDPASLVRFVKLDAHGRPTNGDHVAVYDSKTGLTWMADVVPGGERPWAQAMEASAAVTLFGKSDWRAPTIQELLSIVDYERYDPAVDTEYFKGPFGYTWSSTVAKAPSGYAWFVYLGDGYSYRYNQTYDYHVRAVRADQFLELKL